MLRWVFVLLLASVSLFAEDDLLIRPGDYWRYRAIAPSLPDPAANWTSVSYDDAAWGEVISSFTSFINGDPGATEATILPVNVNTVCFRKSFTLQDPSFVRWLTLQIDYESGFVAYLNGAEIGRRGFPADLNPVPFSAIATNHPRRVSAPEWIDVSASGNSVLRAGTNVLAIQLHNAGSDNAGLLLIAQLKANFTRGPFVQNMSSNATQVIWRTQNATTGSVSYGKDVDHFSTVVAPDSANLHAVWLTNLEAGQKYFYRVTAQAIGETASSDWATFRTLKAPGNPISFLVMGDSGQASVGQYRIAARMNETPADLVMHVGDVVYPGFSALHADARFFDIYHDQIRGVPYYLTLGNHDQYGRADFLASFYLPSNNIFQSENLFSFDHGDVHFIVLSTDTAVGERYDPNSYQYQWLEADLKATRQPWKFIFFHHVFRSSSIHTYDDYLFDGTYDKFQLQAYIGGLAEKYGAQMIFNGHDHDYERFAPFDGINSIVSGGGGASLYGQVLDNTGKLFVEEGSLQFFTRYNFLHVTVDGPQLTIEGVDDSGVVFDRMYRSQVGGGATGYPSTWGSAQVESTAGNDSDGNILGQTFNFTDAGIATFAGSNANLGRFHVRNDRDALYLGLDYVGIHDFQAVGLFVENTANPGVTSLVGLGNHQIDPTGQGVDGFDYLTNLGFKNFRPSIGCLLGDELADANLRSFKRAGMNWATGQGVFQLTSGFPNVEGARLQQFNRNPQGPAVPAPESNADFIEVAIPWNALGATTGTVRVAAIVMGAMDDTTNRPALDTAYLGQSFAPGDTTSFLEPITIQLARDPDADGFAFRGVFVAPNVIRFTWNSVNGASYKLQSTAALGIPFQDATAAITANGAQTTYDLNLNNFSAPQFFRLSGN